MRSQNYSSECILLRGKLQHHRSGDSRSVYESNRLASSSEHSSTLSSIEKKSCKCTGQATSPSPSYVNLDKRLAKSLMMSRGSTYEKHHGGMSVTVSMIDVQRFKRGCKGSTCHLDLLLASEMLNVLDPPTCQGISPVRSPN